MEPKRDLEFEVKQSHIDKGEVKSLSNCPAALALLDTIDAKCKVFVSEDCFAIHFMKANNIAYYKTSKKLKDFIINFDWGYEVSPETFQAIRTTIHCVDPSFNLTGIKYGEEI